MKNRKVDRNIKEHPLFFSADEYTISMLPSLYKIAQNNSDKMQGKKTKNAHGICCGKSI